MRKTVKCKLFGFRKVCTSPTFELPGYFKHHLINIEISERFRNESTIITRMYEIKLRAVVRSGYGHPEIENRKSAK